MAFCIGDIGLIRSFFIALRTFFLFQIGPYKCTCESISIFLTTSRCITGELWEHKFGAFGNEENCGKVFSAERTRQTSLLPCDDGKLPQLGVCKERFWGDLSSEQC